MAPALRLLRKIPRLIAAAVVLFLVVGVAAVVLDPSGPEHCSELEQDLERLRTENLTIERANDQLQREIEAIQGDSRMVEQIAREELGMIRPGELVYRFQR